MPYADVSIALSEKRSLPHSQYENATFGVTIMASQVPLDDPQQFRAQMLALFVQARAAIFEQQCRDGLLGDGAEPPEYLLASGVLAGGNGRQGSPPEQGRPPRRGEHHHPAGDRPFQGERRWTGDPGDARPQVPDHGPHPQVPVGAPRPPVPEGGSASNGNGSANGDAATKKQIGFLLSIAKRERRLSPTQVKTWIKDEYGKGLDQLTKAEASAAIDAVKGQ